MGAGTVTTRQNRLASLVPLRYEFAHRLKREHPALRVELNGGVKTTAEVRTNRASHPGWCTCLTSAVPMPAC